MSGDVRAIRAIITADDLGLSPAVNDAVAELAASGTVTATSLLVGRDHAQAALELELPIAVGLHVEFEPAWLATAGHAEIEAAIEDQVDWMRTRAAPPTHLDLHTEALYGLGPEATRPGGVLMEAIAVAARHRLPLRLPRRLPDGTGAPAAHRLAVALADDSGVRLPETIHTDPRPVAAIDGPRDAARTYAAAVGTLPAGVSEFFLHPAVAEIDGLGAKRVWEFELLRDGLLRARLEAAGVVPTSWAAHGASPQEGAGP
ncbi:ChbG/HpnK family deacetylase [Occultella glacieicola]|uniref:ChbG/HpnK family deacetylase n=1 Tax=Occultella glacieicola TaxID=2518684 RepID=A0ABY2E1S1_9MICO|nr:ChbG/HpnK family deacetylase [Occultella glacieicola]TDE88466.1 ChbG/HpnK family deacetylase [Occultella glacieicola]